MSPRSFYQAADLPQREALLAEYLQFMSQRNGVFDPSLGGYVRRQAHLQRLQSSTIRYRGQIDSEHFHQLYDRFRPDSSLDRALLVALAFVRLNAGESYGVRVTAGVREARRGEASDLLSQVEHEVTREEDIHTQLLVGAAAHFDLEVAGAYRPSLPLKLLIHSIAYSPKVLFHPILLASEVMGIYTFNWMLNQLSTLLPEDPDLRELLEERLIEVLIDEVGHVCFNRLAVGPTGLKLGRFLVPIVVDGVPKMTPELGALGFDRSVKRAIRGFDFSDLPQQVREQSFFA